MEQKGSNFIRLFIGLTLLVVALCMMIGFVIFFFVFVGSKREVKGFENEPLTNYKVLEIDLSENEVSYRSQKLPSDCLNHDQFIYQADEEKVQLISNFGSQEWVCTGSCYCEDSDFRRKTATTVMSGRFAYLLVAASSVLAYGIAQNYFEDDCQAKLKDECAMESIKSDVDGCSTVEESSGDDVSEKANQPKKYECSGHCIPNTKFSEDIQKEAGCESIRHNSVLEVEEMEEFHANELMEDWSKSELDPFCRGFKFKDGSEEVCVGFDQAGVQKTHQFNQCRELPWWHRSNIGSYEYTSSGMGGGGGDGCAEPPSGGCCGTKGLTQGPGGCTPR